MEAATRAEIVSFIKRSTFRLVVLLDEHGENVVPSRFIFAVKRSTTRETNYKARLVIGGHRDREMNRMVHTASTLSHTSVHPLLVIASFFGVDI